MSRYTFCAENITVTAGSRTIVPSASFTCRGIVGLFGRNGAGKTSLIRALMGGSKKGQGCLYLLNDDGKRILLSEMNPRERAKYIAYIPQDSSGSIHMKVLDFLVTGRTPYLGMFDSPKKSDYAMAEEAAGRHGIKHLLDRYTDEISGGERKMAYIARASVQNACWMILDEPTAGLDYGRQREFFDALRRSVSESGTGAIVSLHDPHLAERFCDEVLVVNDGKIYKSENIWNDVEAIYGAR